MSKEIWVGVDVAKDSFVAAFADETTRVDGWAKMPNCSFPHTATGMRAFLAWLDKGGVCSDNIACVCLESTGRLASRWAMLLDQRLKDVSIVNPARPAAFAKSLGLRDKSDRVDACILALFARATHPRPSQTISKTHLELRELYRLHIALENQKYANENRLADGPSSRFVRSELNKTIRALNRQIERLEREMDKLIEEDAGFREDARLMGTIKGIGVKTVRAILAEFGDLRLYKRNELVALAGLFPKEFSSGKSVHKKPRLAKGGGSRVRKALYMCALVSSVHNPHMKTFAERLKANGKAPMQAIGALMRKLLLLLRAVVVSGKDYDPCY